MDKGRQRKRRTDLDKRTHKTIKDGQTQTDKETEIEREKETGRKQDGRTHGEVDRVR